MHCLARRAHGNTGLGIQRRSRCGARADRARRASRRRRRAGRRRAPAGCCRDRSSGSARPARSARRNAPSSLRSRGLKIHLRRAAHVPGRVPAHRLAATDSRHEFGCDCHGHGDLRRLVMGVGEDAASCAGSPCDTALMCPAPIVTITSLSRITSRERGREVLDLLDEHGLDLAAAAHGAADGAAVGAGDRRFARGVHLGDEQHVRGGERLAEVVDEIAHARVAMRLEREHEAAAADSPGAALRASRRFRSGDGRSRRRS